MSDDGGADDGPEGTGATGGTAVGGAPTCPFCEAPLYERHCKYVCPQHGVVVDCSDPFR
ncbi:HVO_2523 family zinc finger protein [Salinilacihabitans rarus]|uniref:HVO_2523 family zinc finger protein n=1 Tax=Salinilacihabitans rarus TaxID=2961596 RepID=UPI0020C88260|nr:HVO_2523 family zinc finger protein [Salinilacihabitans rarus]